jgi:hypothetical protein
MIAVVYHIYCVNDWKETASEQLNRLVSSGLYDKADKLFATIINQMNVLTEPMVSDKEVSEFFSKYPKFELSYGVNYYEYAGLKKVYDICIENDCKVLYFHAKGVSNKYRRYDKQEEISKTKVESIKSWREVLESFLIDNWRDCVDKLDNYDNVGVTCDNGWFWGNFWWSKSNHIRTKEEPLCHVGRWYYEAWLNERSNAKNYEYYKFTINPYRCVVSKKYYDGTYKGKMDQLEILSAYYGSYDIQTDEGRIPNDEPIEIDVTEVITKNYKENGNLNNIPINNDYFEEDPHYGKHKQLRILFTVKGYTEIHTIVFDEYRGTYFSFI